MSDILWQEIYTTEQGHKYIRSYIRGTSTWSNWYRNDNYGTTSLAELTSALGMIKYAKQGYDASNATTLTNATGLLILGARYDGFTSIYRIAYGQAKLLAGIEVSGIAVNGYNVTIPAGNQYISFSSYNYEY